METLTTCTKCGVSIQEATARRNGGLCAPCAKGAFPCVDCGKKVMPIPGVDQSDGLCVQCLSLRAQQASRVRESDLNHPKVTPLTRELAASYALDGTFVDFVFAEKKPACFDYHCEPASNGWTCDIPDEYDRAHPLWSSNANQTLLLASKAGIRFGHGYHDDPEINLVARTTQGLLADLFIDLYERNRSASPLHEGAVFCGFQFLAECKQFQLDQSGDFNQWQKRKAEFIAFIDGRCG